MAGYQCTILCWTFSVFVLISFSTAAYEEEPTMIRKMTQRELYNGSYNGEEQFHDTLHLRNIKLKSFLSRKYKESFSFARSFNYPCGEFLTCYVHFKENIGTTYHSTCLARGKLTGCKNVILSAYPLILTECSLDPDQVRLEYISDYVCTHPNGSSIYVEFEKCPFVKPAIPLFKDFTPYTHINKARADMAFGILQETGALHCGLNSMNKK